MRFAEEDLCTLLPDDKRVGESVIVADVCGVTSAGASLMKVSVTVVVVISVSLVGIKCPRAVVAAEVESDCLMGEEALGCGRVTTSRKRGAGKSIGASIDLPGRASRDLGRVPGKISRDLWRETDRAGPCDCMSPVTSSTGLCEACCDDSGMRFDIRGVGVRGVLPDVCVIVGKATVAPLLLGRGLCILGADPTPACIDFCTTSTEYGTVRTGSVRCGGCVTTSVSATFAPLSSCLISCLVMFTNRATLFTASVAGDRSTSASLIALISGVKSDGGIRILLISSITR
jgi:hypothetical protein